MTPAKILKTFRKAIADSKKTRAQIAQESGVSRSAIDKFMKGHDINLLTAAKLADVLELGWASL